MTPDQMCAAGRAIIRLLCLVATIEFAAAYGRRAGRHEERGLTMLASVLAAFLAWIIP